jgi:hypothetical protein
MSTFSALAPYIIVALLAVAMLIPGLNATQKAIEDLIEDKKKTTVEACIVSLERERGSKIYSSIEKSRKLKSCEDKLNAEIQKAYNPSLFYICKTRQLVTLTDENPDATSEAIETSAASPALTSQCAKYDNNTQQ